jgi:GAF domain-containing protein
MRAADGQLLGILSVDEPISGRKPTGDEIDVLVAVSEHAAIVVQAAQEAADAKANREALERLLAVSTRLNETWDTSELLHLVCEAISEALGFDKVAVQLLHETDGVHNTIASVGFGEGQNSGTSLTADELERILKPAVAGSATSGSTTRMTGYAPTPSACRSCARLRTRRPLRSATRPSSTRFRTHTSTTAR